MTYNVTLDNNRTWTVVASDKDEAIKKTTESAEMVDAWEWADGEIAVTPFYGMWYDYDHGAIYDNGGLAIADWTKYGTWSSSDNMRPTTKMVRGENGFLYEISFYHDGTFMCAERR